MSKLFLNLWNDDCGALISIEFLFIVTLLIFGVMVGIVAVRDAVVTELNELANAILALDQDYTFSGLTGCCAIVNGSATTDSPALVPDALCIAPQAVSNVDQTPCN